MKLTISKKAGFVLAVAGATAVGSVSTAAVMAAVPDSSGAIHGCYSKNAGLFDGKGTVRIIDTASESCKSSETAISWNQTGPKGDKGDKGDMGDTGATGAQGSKGDKGDPGVGRDTIGLRTDLDDAVFTASTLQNYDFSHRTLNNVNFGANFTRLRNIDFSYSVFNGGVLGDNSLNEFIGADVRALDLSGTYRAANFTGADLSGHTLASAVGVFHALMTDNIFSGANLGNNDFVGASFLGSDLSTANLSGSTWDNTICPDGTNSNDNGSTCIGHLVPVAP